MHSWAPRSEHLHAFKNDFCIFPSIQQHFHMFICVVWHTMEEKMLLFVLTSKSLTPSWKSKENGGSCNRTDMIYITQIAFKFLDYVHLVTSCLRAGGLNSVTLRPSMMFLLVKIVDLGWLFFQGREVACETGCPMGHLMGADLGVKGAESCGWSSWWASRDIST